MPEDIERQLYQLYIHLREASRLVEEIGDENLPIASPGRGYIEWSQLQWMTDAMGGEPLKKGKQQ